MVGTDKPDSLLLKFIGPDGWNAWAAALLVSENMGLNRVLRWGNRAPEPAAAESVDGRL
jgi:hypothetical protein